MSGRNEGDLVTNPIDCGRIPNVRNKIEYSHISLKVQRRTYNRNQTVREVKGFDTETDKGYVRVISDSNSYTVANSLYDCLAYLTRFSNRNTINLFYNLAFDVECTLKWDEATVRRIAETNEASYKGFKLRYLSKKCLTIQDSSKHVYKFYDIAQFYRTSLEKAALRYLGEKVHELKQHRENLFQKYPIRKIGEYCRSDAQLTGSLGELFLRALRTQNLPVRHLYSGGYVSQQFALRYSRLPTLWNTPNIVNRLYWNAYRGGWFDTYKKGMFKITAYDLKSAYPAAMLNLPHLGQGHWKRGLLSSSDIGVVQAIISCQSLRHIPLAVHIMNTNIYPHLNRKLHLSMTLNEYRTLANVMDIKPTLAYSFVPDRDVTYPYKNLVHKLYKLKESYKKDDARYLSTKIILNSLYGKCAELVRKTDSVENGRLFNPVYAAEITARVRLKLYEDMVGVHDNVVSILTDCILFDSPVNLKTGSKLGDWELKEKNKTCLIIGSGLYEFENGSKATRGISRKTSLFDAVNSSSTKINTYFKRPQHYKECVRQKRINEIGYFMQELRQLDVNRDIKRIWKIPILKARELLEKQFESVAVPVSALLPYLP